MKRKGQFFFACVAIIAAVVMTVSCVSNPTVPKMVEPLNQANNSPGLFPTATPETTGATISGTVSNAGNYYITITATEVFNAANMEQVTIIGDGPYNITNLVDGEYNIQAGTSNGVSQVYGTNIDIVNGASIADIDFTF